MDYQKYLYLITILTINLMLIIKNTLGEELQHIENDNVNLNNINYQQITNNNLNKNHKQKNVNDYSRINNENPLNENLAFNNGNPINENLTMNNKNLINANSKLDNNKMSINDNSNKKYNEIQITNDFKSTNENLKNKKYFSINYFESRLDDDNNINENRSISTLQWLRSMIFKTKSMYKLHKLEFDLSGCFIKFIGKILSIIYNSLYSFNKKLMFAKNIKMEDIKGLQQRNNYEEINNEIKLYKTDIKIDISIKNETNNKIENENGNKVGNETKIKIENKMKLNKTNNQMENETISNNLKKETKEMMGQGEKDNLIDPGQKEKNILSKSDSHKSMKDNQIRKQNSQKLKTNNQINNQKIKKNKEKRKSDDRKLKTESQKLKIDQNIKIDSQKMKSIDQDQNLFNKNIDKEQNQITSNRIKKYLNYLNTNNSTSLHFGLSRKFSSDTILDSINSIILYYLGFIPFDNSEDDSEDDNLKALLKLIGYETTENFLTLKNGFNTMRTSQMMHCMKNYIGVKFWNWIDSCC